MNLNLNRQVQYLSLWFWRRSSIFILLLLTIFIFRWWWIITPSSIPTGVPWKVWDPVPSNLLLPWALQSCVTNLSDIGFVLMVSSANSYLHTAQRSTFLLNAPYKWTFSDSASEHTITLPEIEGKTSYADAQHRQLRGMQWLLRQGLSSSLRWYILIDDDTWVHSPVLLRMLSSLESRFDPTREKIILGNRWHSGVFNGGAGLVLSSAGFSAIAESLYTPLCPFDKANDDTISFCVRNLGGFHSIHSSLFSWYPKEPIISYRDFMEMATMHSIKDPALMLALQKESNGFCKTNWPYAIETNCGGCV
jgi:hypothetical protein